MTTRLSKKLGDRPLGFTDAIDRLNRDVVPVMKELVQKANQHVVVVPVTAPGLTLEPAPGRIVLVEVDTSAASWSAGDVALPDVHFMGDEFIVHDIGGLAGAAAVTVTSDDTITGSAVLNSNYGSLRLLSNGEAWRSV